MGKAVEITDSNFNEIVTKNDVVLVDFWAEWCGPCRMIAPMIEELANEYDGKAVIGKLDVDNNQESSIKFGVRSIPTLLVFKDGEIDKDELKILKQSIEIAVEGINNIDQIK